MQHNEHDECSHADATFGDLDVWPEGIDQYREGPPDNPRAITRADRIFKRDVVEVTYNLDGRPFSLFCCHLKSMTGGRAATRVMRMAEAMAVRAIIEKRFARHRGGPAAANWAIVGDLNDYYEVDGSRDLRDYMTGEDSPSALGVLVEDGFAVDLMARRAPEDRWTTYHAPDDLYTQLDYRLTDDVMLYASYKTGYQAAGTSNPGTMGNFYSKNPDGSIRFDDNGNPIRATSAEVNPILTFDGSTVKLFAEAAEEYSAAQSGTPTTAIPFCIGALNNNGTAGSFSGVALKDLLVGRQALTLAQFKSLRTQLIAGA